MQQEELVLQNRHGKRLSTTVRTPEGVVKGTVVVLHGLAGWKDQSTILVMADAFVHAGYRTVTFDGANCLRGPDASFWQHTVTGFIEDTEDVIAYVRTQPWFADPLLLAGHSLGALCAVRYAKVHKNIAKLVLVAPAISLLNDRGARFLRKLGYMMKVVRILTKRQKETGEKFLLSLYPPWLFDYLKYDVRKDVPAIDIPVLIVSAGDDMVVAGPGAHGALTQSFAHAVHEIIPDASHIFHEHEAALADTITTWLT